MWCSSLWRRPTPCTTRSCPTLTDPPAARTTTTPALRMASLTEGRGTACQEVRNSGGEKRRGGLCWPCVSILSVIRQKLAEQRQRSPIAARKKMLHVFRNSPKPDSIFTSFPFLSLMSVPLFATNYRNAGFQLPQQQQLWDHSGAQLWQVPQWGHAQELLGSEPQLAGQLHRAGRCDCSRRLEMCFLILVEFRWLKLCDYCGGKIPFMVAIKQCWPLFDDGT